MAVPLICYDLGRRVLRQIRPTCLRSLSPNHSDLYHALLVRCIRRCRGHVGRRARQDVHDRCTRFALGLDARPEGKYVGIDRCAWIGSERDTAAVRFASELSGCKLMSLSSCDVRLTTSHHQHPEASVRQSAYALLGDMAISCTALAHLLPLFLPRLVKEISDQIAQPRNEEVSVCNNAAWAVGEIAMQCRPTAGEPTRFRTLGYSC